MFYLSPSPERQGCVYNTYLWECRKGALFGGRCVLLPQIPSFTLNPPKFLMILKIHLNSGRWDFIYLNALTDIVTEVSASLLKNSLPFYKIVNWSPKKTVGLWLQIYKC